MVSAARKLKQHHGSSPIAVLRICFVRLGSVMTDGPNMMALTSLNATLSAGSAAPPFFLEARLSLTAPCEYSSRVLGAPPVRSLTRRTVQRRERGMELVRLEKGVRCSAGGAGWGSGAGAGSGSGAGSGASSRRFGGIVLATR